ncbi:antibiotic biosynthesis monooxygenase [Erwinia tracheiphila]|uniref:Antibiotic biosynthesis monooxygenase n=1 Tax=Erwinia tracheiphila TaxID=65700 RepID=A0A345CY66_9GAMM|nr:antibiotic biosynthesis monooxygenase [Erwinia tracheiphila]AXF78383.1 antibiotic biosynthesis monooxygenase [Erwinia tracheiphila]UIA85800.1 antibiotic biosynthesis monooxygenase [Erwinia tracheiphila]UIA94323.1 antibiotic biosynthesis monooxygenase [Erwinia tracheiphila]
MLTVIAEICVRPGRHNAVLEAIKNLLPVVLQEEGCDQYQPLIDHKAQAPWKQHSPDSIFMLEQHQQTEHMEQHRSLIKDDVVEVKIFVLEPIK